MTCIGMYTMDIWYGWFYIFIPSSLRKIILSVKIQQWVCKTVHGIAAKYLSSLWVFCKILITLLWYYTMYGACDQSSDYNCTDSSLIWLNPD